MHDEAEAWLHDDRDAPTRSGRRVLLVLAAVPWFVIAVWLIVTRVSDASSPPPAIAAEVTAGSADDFGDPDRAHHAEEQAVVHPDGAPAERGPEDADAPAVTGEGAGVPASGSEARPPLGSVAAAAFATARAYFADPLPSHPVDGLGHVGQMYLEHLALEVIDIVSSDTVVVVLATILLPVHGEEFGPAEHRRLAVPMTVDADGAQPAGPPWWLPSRPLSLTPPVLQPVEDPALLAGAAQALVDAGYRDVQVRQLGWDATGAYVAEVTATTSSGLAVDGPVWLHAHHDRLWLAGSTHPPDLTDTGVDRPDAD